MRRFLKTAGIISSTILLCIACSSSKSKGEKAAKEVIKSIQSGNMEKAKQDMIKYGDTLDDSDLIDFYDALQSYGL